MLVCWRLKGNLCVLFVDWCSSFVVGWLVVVCLLIGVWWFVFGVWCFAFVFGDLY